MAPTRLTSRQRLLGNLTFDQLYTFTMVVRAGSFSAAAKDLALTQPAVSQRIRHLEQTLGTNLLDRTPGTGTSLTVDGQEFLGFAQQILRMMDEFHAELEGTKRESQDAAQLTIASSSDYIGHMLMRVMADLYDKNPALKLVLRHCPSAVQTGKMVLDGEADLGLGRAPAPEGVQVLGFVHEHLYLVAHPDDPITQATYDERIPALSTHRFSTFAPDMRSRQLVDRWAEQHDLELDVLIESRNLETMKKAVIQGLSVAILPSYSVEEEIANGLLTMVDVPSLPLSRDAVIFSRTEVLSYEAKLVLDAINAHFHAEQEPDVPFARA